MFHILYKIKTWNQLKFQQLIMPVHCACTTVELLCHETLDFVIAPKMWLLNIPHFSPVHYRIWVVLQEPVSNLCEMLVN